MESRTPSRFAAAVIPLLLLSPAAAGEEPAKAPPAGDSAKVVKEPLRIEVSLAGVLEGARKAEVLLDPEVWTTFEVSKAVEQGTRVKKGDPLVEFETEKMDEEIRDQRAASELSALSLAQAEDEFRWFKESLPMDLAAAMRARQNSEEDLKRYLEVDAPLLERNSQNSLKQSQFGLEYAAEELRQLEKMYKADDLTEETEEIILTRARRDVENARFYLESATIHSQEAEKITFPRQKEGMIEANKRQEIATEKATTGLAKSETKKKLDLQKQKADHEKAQKRLARLEKDRARAVIASPQDGIVYYGRFVRGKWTDPGPLNEELKPGGTLTGRKVLMTVVEPRPLFIHSEVPEKDLAMVRAGVEGKATPASLPGVRLKARVDRVSPVQFAPGMFDVRLEVELGEEAKDLLPGMDCPVKLLGYQNPEARTIPPAAVFLDDGDQPYVYLAKPGAKPEKRTVKVGKRTEAKVEVLDGLAEGDEVLLKKPTEETK
jgi:HlyD family secretion protein